MFLFKQIIGSFKIYFANWQTYPQHYFIRPLPLICEIKGHFSLPFDFGILDTIFKIVCLQIYETFYVSIQFSSVAQSCPTLCDPMNCSTPGLPVHHQLPEPTRTYVHWVGDAIQPSHPLSSPSPALNLSQHQGLFKWVSSLHQVDKVLEFQLQHQSF